MKIVQVNSVCGIGSTGRICVGISDVVRSMGHECVIAYGRKRASDKFDGISYRIGSDFSVKSHALRSRIYGKSGIYSKAATKKFLAWLNDYKPDILHLHNLHGYYINFPMLMDYIKVNHIRTIWTLHDCWAFTGRCAYFDMANCDKWKCHCRKCPQLKAYPRSISDDSSRMFELKKDCFSGIDDLTIVTPSQWLADLVKQSFLRDYDLRVIHNGIDLKTFKPTPSDIKKRLHSEGKFVVLGVAFNWGASKGLDVFVNLAEKLGNKYRVVLVGIDEAQQKALPDSIIAINRTNSAGELADLYSVADVFVNPTRQDNFPTVNIEALACGTPIVMFNTGGSPESIDDTCGIVVEKNDIDKMLDSVKAVCETEIFTKEACVRRAKQFDAVDKFREYVKLYEGLK